MPRSSTASACARRSGYRYRNCDLADLEARLREAAAAGARFKLVVTDGVFSMDGSIAAAARDLRRWPSATARWSWSTTATASASSGPAAAARPSTAASRPRGHPHRHPRQGARRGERAATSSGRREIVELLRQRSRPYLFSNTPPALDRRGVDGRASSSSSARTELRDGCRRTPASSARASTPAGLAVRPGMHPIVPVMLGDAALAQRFADEDAREGRLRGRLLPSRWSRRARRGSAPR